MKRKVLFIGTTVAKIYLDIIEELEKQNYEVDFFEYRSFKKDPHNLKGYRKYGSIFVPVKSFNKFIESYWIGILNLPEYNKKYDFLFVLDGDSLHKCIFDILKSRNPNLKTINYLFDSTHSNYEFNVHFPLFDKVFSFELEDCKKYHLQLLPIYWKPVQIESLQTLKFFGMGSYMENRFLLYSKLQQYSNENKLNSFIRIYAHETNFSLKYKIKKKIIESLGYNSYMIPQEHYNSDMITHKMIPTDKYMELIMQSEIIIDTNAEHQDGLTARFMWALGAEQKIITTNKSVIKYDFYTPEQIFIVEDIDNFINTPPFFQFCHSTFHMSESIRNSIIKYRIDNWVKLMFN